MKPKENFHDTLRRMPWWGWIVLAFLLLPIMVWLAGRLVPSPRDQIENTVKRLARMVEQEDVQGIGGYVAHDFQDETGQDRDTILEQATEVFGQIENIQISLKRVMINITGTGEAEALVVYHFSASWLGSGVYDRVPVNSVFEKDASKPEKVYVRFKRLGDRWRVKFISFDTLPYRARFDDAERYY